jgi:alpha-ketoglutarate-dependent taurine dioxygenase
MDHARPGPFDLDDSGPYREWRSAKLSGWPTDLDQLRVRVARLAEPSTKELGAISAAVARANLALILCPDPVADSADLLAFGRRLGLERLDTNLCADDQAVSAIAVRPAGTTADYIPYTDRPLSWHTDGYYNPADRQVRAWMLFCVRDAAVGGENALLDPELAYIALRDEDPALVRALMAPDAMTVPANRSGGEELRAASTGPVFSVIRGRLHMRYSARTRNILWRPDPLLEAARARLSTLLSQRSDYMFHHKLRPGEGFVSNNVLHNRAGFTDPTGAGRLLLRTRYLDPISVLPHPANG